MVCKRTGVINYGKKGRIGSIFDRVGTQFGDKALNEIVTIIKITKRYRDALSLVGKLLSETLGERGLTCTFDTGDSDQWSAVKRVIDELRKKRIVGVE